MTRAKALQWVIALDIVLGMSKEEAGPLPRGAARELVRAQADIAGSETLSL